MLWLPGRETRPPPYHALGAIFPGAAAVRREVPAAAAGAAITAPTAYWPLNDNAWPSTVTGVHALQVNSGGNLGLLSATTLQPKRGGALDNTSKGYFLGYRHADSNFSTVVGDIHAVDWSACCWFQPTGSLPDGATTIDDLITLSVQEAGSARTTFILRLNDATNWQAYYTTNGTNYTQVGSSITTPVPTLGTWAFLAIWYNATTHVLSFSVNDGAVQTANLGGNTLYFNSNCDLLIGGWGGQSGHNAKGYLDEAGWWNGHAFTSAEVTALYNAGAGVTYSGSTWTGSASITAPSAYWTLDTNSWVNAVSGGTSLTGSSSPIPVLPTVTAILGDALSIPDKTQFMVYVHGNADFSATVGDLTGLSWSACAWYMPRGALPDGATTIDDVITLSQDPGHGSGTSFILRLNDATHWQAYYATAGGGGTDYTQIGSITTPIPALHTWAFLMLRYNAATGDFGFSVNGGTVSTANIGAGAIYYSATNDFQVGGWTYTGGHIAQGFIDEVGWWKNHSLTDAEIALLYNAGAGRTFSGGIWV